jgi:hypothetical protein
VSPFANQGEIDPGTARKAVDLILMTDQFIVFLHEEHSVWWSEADDFIDPPEFGRVADRVAELESVDVEGLPCHQLLAFQRQIGEGVARALSGQQKEADEILDRAAAYIKARNEERARLCYVSSSTAVPARGAGRQQGVIRCRERIVARG